jgi:hypothetical protein
LALKVKEVRALVCVVEAKVVVYVDISADYACDLLERGVLY